MVNFESVVEALFAYCFSQIQTKRRLPQATSLWYWSFLLRCFG